MNNRFLKWRSSSKIILVTAFIAFFTAHGGAYAGGLFGPPQPISREAGGLHTAIGYGYHEDQYQNGTKHVLRQNQVYSELGYGTQYWEVYGRIGGSDLKISDAFRPTQVSTTTSQNDFDDRWSLFGTLGAKGFYPFNKTFGMGAFVQGSYSFQDFTDGLSGTRNGTPFTTELKVKNLWDVNFGVGFQATVPKGIKLYIGPYIYYSEAKESLSPTLPGLPVESRNGTITNETIVGGFTGVDVPLAKGFHLNVEGKYSQRFSVGAAIAYAY